MLLTNCTAFSSVWKEVMGEWLVKLRDVQIKQRFASSVLPFLLLRGVFLHRIYVYNVVVWDWVSFRQEGDIYGISNRCW